MPLETSADFVVISIKTVRSIVVKMMVLLLKEYTFVLSSRGFISVWFINRTISIYHIE